MGSALGQVGFEDLDFGFFFDGEFFAAAFAEHVDGFAALFEQGVHYLHFSWFVERFHGVDLMFFESAFDHADDAKTGFVFGFHGFYHVFLNCVQECH